MKLEFAEDCVCIYILNDNVFGVDSGGSLTILPSIMILLQFTISKLKEHFVHALSDHLITQSAN